VVSVPAGALRTRHALALPSEVAPRSVRLQRWVARVLALPDGDAFYARSSASDPLGTADTLLGWRDMLAIFNELHRGA
jgi:hypothetical protein